jgi:type IV pilus assembly protein PilB
MSNHNYHPLASLANHLIQEGLLQPMLAKQANDEANQTGCSFLNYLVSNNIVNSDEVLKMCIKRFGLPTFDLNHYNHHWLTSIDMKLIFRYRIVPLYKNNNVLYIGISDPTEQHALNIIMFNTGLRTFPVLVSEDQLDQLIKSFQKNRTDNTIIQNNSSDNTVIQKNSPVHTTPQENSSVKTIIQKNSSINTIFQENSSLNPTLQKNNAVNADIQKNSVVNAGIQKNSAVNTATQKNISDNKDMKDMAVSLLNDISSDDPPSILQKSASNEDEPLIKFVDQIIYNAVYQSVSDIHIEPYEKYVRIRYRLDGILHKVNELPAYLASRLCARLKVMSKLDITERRLPQDGRFQWRHIDVRINTCPTLHGEKIVLRLLDASNLLLDLPMLGLTEEQRTILQHKISAPHGLILVTGPTGCGKTVTLYSTLNYLNTPEKNISTVENPIEIQLPGINQVNINPKIHLDFPTSLRALLRQDPDIVMIGEIRDKETADTAIQAAETGHLVLSTLHTNSAIETINRFKSMHTSIDHFMNALTLIIAQRLIRVLCQYCKQPEFVLKTIPNGITNSITGDHSKPIFRAEGCQHCFNGYRGRTGIYEFFPITEKISELILSDASKDRIEKEALSSGYVPLRTIGIEKIMNGTTSLMEIQRVLQL